jgi:hypothetical protein
LVLAVTLQPTVQSRARVQTGTEYRLAVLLKSIQTELARTVRQTGELVGPSEQLAAAECIGVLQGASWGSQQSAVSSAAAPDCCAIQQSAVSSTIHLMPLRVRAWSGPDCTDL